MARSKTDRDPAAVEMGARIRAARDKMGYSQDELAHLLSVTKGAVGQWEIGAGTPKPQKFEQIAEVLGVGARWLLTGKEPDDAVRAVTKAEADALAVLRDLPVQQQTAALAILRAFRDGITKK